MVRRPVFVTRRFPPSVGGMETLAASVWRSLQASRPDAILLAHGGSNRELLWWLPVTCVRLTWLLVTRRVQFVLTGDAVMHAVVQPLVRLSGVRAATMVLGLDVTYNNALYRRLVTARLRSASHVIAISAATRTAVLEAGVDPERVNVLRLGVAAPPDGRPERRRARAEVLQLLGCQDGVILLTLGRLVRRKGARWFIEKVLPRLPDDVHYAVAGDGPEAQAVKEAAQDPRVVGRVHILGRVSESVRESLMQGCDVFVQPNIRVPGDMEGFGLVTVEAAMRGTPVVAADLEGIKDAVVPGTTGLLLPPADAEAWCASLTELTRDFDSLEPMGKRFQQGAHQLYSERRMGEALLELLDIDESRQP